MEARAAEIVQEQSTALLFGHHVYVSVMVNANSRIV